MQSFDVLVIGGGINGTGIARDLAGRGINTMLCEKGDLGGATSSVSSKLVHGGVTYLCDWNFGLIKNCLRERETLLNAAPHLVRPIDFIIPYKDDSFWAMWKQKIGLYIYDRLFSGSTLPKSYQVDMTSDRKGASLQSDYINGFIYTDCFVDDARLVIANAQDAHEKGAMIGTHTQCCFVEPSTDKTGWLVTLRDNISGKKGKVFANVVVNASGPWVNNVLDIVDTGIVTHNIRWVKGSHIIVNRLYNGEHGYLLKHKRDKRSIFVMPYESGYSLIGYSDTDYVGDINDVHTDLYEVEYLCEAVNDYFKRPLTAQDVEWTFSGIIPVLDDKGSGTAKVKKNYVIETTEHQGGSIISIYGGTITSYRALAEEVGDRVRSILRKGTPSWTEKAELPGAEGYSASFKGFYKAFVRDYQWLPKNLLNRYIMSYGVRARDMLAGVKSIADMGIYFGDGVYEIEVKYLTAKEWALTSEDILFRRSKLGLGITTDTYDKIEQYLQKALNAA